MVNEVLATCRMFVLESEEAAKKMAALHATDKKELMFTTYRWVSIP